jgi:hypothetical protein
MNPPDLRWGTWPLWPLAGAALWLSLRTKLHPALLIVAGGAVGWLL